MYMPVLCVFHVQQNGEQDFTVNLFFEISGVHLHKSQRLRFICTMKKLSVASRNQTRRNKREYTFLNDHIFLDSCCFGLKFCMNYLSSHYNNVVL